MGLKPGPWALCPVPPHFGIHPGEQAQLGSSASTASTDWLGGVGARAWCLRFKQPLPHLPQPVSETLAPREAPSGDPQAGPASPQSSGRLLQEAFLACLGWESLLRRRIFRNDHGLVLGQVRFGVFLWDSIVSPAAPSEIHVGSWVDERGLCPMQGQKGERACPRDVEQACEVVGAQAGGAPTERPHCRTRFPEVHRERCACPRGRNLLVQTRPSLTVVPLGTRKLAHGMCRDADSELVPRGPGRGEEWGLPTPHSRVCVEVGRAVGRPVSPQIPMRKS